MKIALLFLALMPFVMSAKIDEKRFLESLLGGIDVLDLGKQLACQFSTEETEQQCEDDLCPGLLSSLKVDRPLVQSLVCGAACEEAQVLAAEFACT